MLGFYFEYLAVEYNKEGTEGDKKDIERKIQEDARKIFKNLDKDVDGKITKKEFADFVSRVNSNEETGQE